MHGPLAVKHKTNVRQGGKMTNEINRQLVLLIAISILCIGILPVVSAADASDNSPTVSHATPEQIELINNLWGSDITIGEYMEKVHPEHLVDVPDDVKNKMFQRKMNWPDGKDEDKITELSRLTSLTVTGYITKVSSTRIDFGGISQLSSGTASYIYVEAFLVNAADSRVDSTAASAQGASSVDTGYKMYFWPADGSYHVHTYGYTITPSLSGSGHSGSVTIP
jgi:hypothetical protein